MEFRRATKIVATLGPASSEPQLLEQMIREGVNVVRLNFSHGSAQDHIDRAANRTAAEQQQVRDGREHVIDGAHHRRDAQHPGDGQDAALDHKIGFSPRFLRPGAGLFPAGSPLSHFFTFHKSQPYHTGLHQ